MKDITNTRKAYEMGDETYKNKFVNPIIKKQLDDLAERIEEISIVRTVLNCFDHMNTYIGRLTIIWGVQYCEAYVIAYETEYDNNDVADTGINATSSCVVESVYDAINYQQAKEISALEYMPIMEEYWASVKADTGTWDK